ncbi:MAG: hypothetical protein AAF645_15320, partial [Myxococcota bacterium]
MEPALFQKEHDLLAVQDELEQVTLHLPTLCAKLSILHGPSLKPNWQRLPELAGRGQRDIVVAPIAKVM